MVFNFMKGVSPVMGEFIIFHDKALVIVVLISLFVGGLIYLIIRNKLRSNVFIEHKLLEFF